MKSKSTTLASNRNLGISLAFYERNVNPEIIAEFVELCAQEWEAAQ